MSEQLFIGELAKRAGVSAKAIRLYEEDGLLPTPQRTPAGYRVYDASAIRVAGFVAQARRLGFRLDEIRDIVKLRQRGQRPCCNHVFRLAAARLAELDKTIAALRQMQRGLRELLRRPGVGNELTVVCPHIEATGQRGDNTGNDPDVARPHVRPLPGGRNDGRGDSRR
jgi:DNA-binding transcriptional MerR regulator